MLLTKSLSHPTTTFDQLAAQDFMQAARQAIWRDLLSWLTRKNNNLLSFEQVRQHLSFKGQHQAGFQAVAGQCQPAALDRKRRDIQQRQFHFLP